MVEYGRLRTAGGLCKISDTSQAPAGVSHCVASAASASLGDVPLGPLCQDATFHLPNLVADLVHKLAGMGDDLWHGSKIGRAPALQKADDIYFATNC